MTIKPTLILAIVTVATVASECSKAPEPKAAADRIRTDSHVVTVSDVRPATKPRDIESACEGQATTIVVCNSCAPANGLVAKGNRGHDARE